jgi:hypothetical protein
MVCLDDNDEQCRLSPAELERPWGRHFHKCRVRISSGCAVIQKPMPVCAIRGSHVPLAGTGNKRATLGV